MKSRLFLCLASLPFMAGCIAFGSEAIATSGSDGEFWLSIIKTFGPMAGMLGWFMHRERARDEKIFGMLADCTKVIAEINATLSEFRKDMEKMRLVLYQLRDKAGVNPAKGDQHELE